MYLDDFFSCPYIQICPVRSTTWPRDIFLHKIRFLISLFSILLLILSVLRSFWKLFRRGGDRSDSVEPDNFVTEIETAQQDFQLVLGGATDDDYDEPHVDDSGLCLRRHKLDRGKNPPLMLFFITMHVLLW